MELQIGNKIIGDEHPVLLIAEAGINHNGDREIAHKQIDAAADAGAQRRLDHHHLFHWRAARFFHHRRLLHFQGRRLPARAQPLGGIRQGQIS